MRTIEVRPSKRFRGYWVSFECAGVEPVYPTQAQATDYACQRFGGSKGEVHVYANDNQTIERVISIGGGNAYSSVSRV